MLAFLLIACASTQPVAEADSPTSSTTTESGTLASWSGGQITDADLDDDTRFQLQRMEGEYLMNRYQTELQIAEGMAIEKMVETEAAAAGVEIEALLQREVESKITPPTAQEIEVFYQENLARMGGRTLAEMNSTLENVLLEEKRGAALQNWLDDLKTRMDFKIMVPFPEMPRVEVSTDDDYFTGPADAPVTIIEFGEYECPYCARSKEITDQVLEAYGDKVRLVYRDFPLGFHQRAIPAAVAANCAGAQGQYFPMHDLILENQGDLSDEAFKRYAEELKLDIAAWETCLGDPAQIIEIQKDMEDGQKAGVSGTPGFFINGIFLGGALPFETFKAIIDRELEG